jgi:enoyl-CoA hydratase
VPYQLPDELLVTGDGPVRTVTLNRPEHRNATNQPLHEGLAHVWAQLAQDPDVRAVVLTGAGRAFSAGGDIEFVTSMADDPDLRYRIMGEARRIVSEMMAFPIPVVAAVNGPAVGLGCSIAMLSDVVLIAESAFIADPHVTIGLVAADGGALCWPLLTSLLKAKEYLLTGDRIPAAVAVELGLANRVVPDDEVLAEAHTLAQRLAAQPRQALQDTKRALNMHLAAAVNTVMDFAFSAESECFTQPGFRQAIGGARSKR